MSRRDRFAIAAVLLWGAALSLWLARVYFPHPADRSHDNHETNTYAGRVIEFRDLLAHGHLSPQWCGHFRGGLGSPYFSYYQPGFFYTAAMVPWSVAPIRAIGAAVAGFAMLGYLGMFGLVGRRFGRLSGWLAATVLLTSVYAATEIYVRGDLSEFAAMMVLPAALWALAGWLEQGRPSHAACLTLTGAALVVLHPVVALLGYGLLGMVIGAFALMPPLSSDLVPTLCVGTRLAGRSASPVPETHRKLPARDAGPRDCTFPRRAWERGNPQWERGNPQWERGNPQWERGNPLAEKGTRWRRPGGALLALGAGVGLTAFYWMPVFFEMGLVQSDRAFTGPYHYANHFINPLELLRPYSRRTTIPFALGLLPIALAVSNTAALVVRWHQVAPSRRRLLLLALGATVLFVLLMTQASAPVWRWLGPLQRLQFPWRILSVVTVLLATAAGAMLPWRSEKARAVLVVALVPLLWVLSWQYTAHELDDTARVPGGVEGIASQHFAPDLRDEWLPRGATSDVPAALRRCPVAGPGCRVEDFRRGQGRLSCRVHSEQPSWVVLPHYYFPVGWRAALDGRPVSLGSDPRGLMLVEVPPGCDAELDVTFTHTPMRRWGLVLSGMTLLLGMGVLVVRKRLRGVDLPGDA